MAYNIPRYLAASRADDPHLHFIWDDTRASEDFRFDATGVVRRAGVATLRARIALGIGIYEWIAYRFRAHSKDPLPFRVAEASWCACIDPTSFDYFEIDRDAWVGPVRGPLWCATTWLLPMVFFSDDEPQEWESGIHYLTRLAMHVLPDPTPFMDWLDAVLDRLAHAYPAPPEDPFDDLFGEHRDQRRGPLIPREALDPLFDLKIEYVPRLVDRYVRDVELADNPLLIRRPVLR
ncbi:MAG: hypothetical protein K0R53_2779 [Burkholderiales bacterium]|jgi:hypothetical protein|nr:hypothetical protein [Burkholderiales bacterium]